jgi:hypothetical protein
MASALSSVMNATVTFQVAKTGTYTDPATGNVLPATRDVTVKLFLKAQSMGVRLFPGVDVTDTVYEGYAVDPVAFDAGVVIGTTGTLTFAAEAPAACEVLELRMNYGSSGLIGSILASTLGQKVRLVVRKF